MNLWCKRFLPQPANKKKLILKQPLFFIEIMQKSLVFSIATRFLHVVSGLLNLKSWILNPASQFLNLKSIIFNPKSSILLLISCVSFLSSCQFNPNYQAKGEDFLQGVWKEVPVTYQDSLMQYTRHSFKFTCDSVYVTLETTAKANYYPDSCFNKGSWKEYAKGNYIVKNDTLFIISTFTKANYKQKLSGCYRIGQYLPTFVIKKREASQLQLQELHQHIPLTLQLTEKVICTPQPL